MTSIPAAARAVVLAVRRRTRWTAGAALAVLCLAGGCERVHYRSYDFSSAVSSTRAGTDVDIATRGTEVIHDSAGEGVSRIASPYWVGIYFYPPAGVEVDVSQVEFVGVQDQRVITPRMSAPVPGGPGYTHQVAVASGVDMPFQDYRVRLRAHIREGATVSEEEITGLLRAEFSERSAFRWWEEQSSI